MLNEPGGSSPYQKLMTVLSHGATQVRSTLCSGIAVALVAQSCRIERVQYNIISLQIPLCREGCGRRIYFLPGFGTEALESSSDLLLWCSKLLFSSLLWR